LQTDPVESFEPIEPPPLPERATCFLPGTSEKVAVMAARWRARRQIHHPDDATARERKDGGGLRTPHRVAHRSRFVYWRKIGIHWRWAVVIRGHYVGVFDRQRDAVAARDR
jgi:hypothetical protein